MGIEKRVTHIKTDISNVEVKGTAIGLYKPYIEIAYNPSSYNFPFDLGIRMAITGEDAGFDFSFKFTIEMWVSIHQKLTLNELYGLHLSVIATAQEFVNKNERLSGCTIPKPGILDIVEEIKNVSGFYDFVLE